MSAETVDVVEAAPTTSAQQVLAPEEALPDPNLSQLEGCDDVKAADEESLVFHISTIPPHRGYQMATPDQLIMRLDTLKEILDEWLRAKPAESTTSLAANLRKSEATCLIGFVWLLLHVGQCKTLSCHYSATPC